MLYSFSAGQTYTFNLNKILTINSYLANSFKLLNYKKVKICQFARQVYTYLPSVVLQKTNVPTCS